VFFQTAMKNTVQKTAAIHTGEMPLHACINRHFRRAALVLAALGAGCAPAIVLPPPASVASAPLTEHGHDRPLAASGQQAWRINAQQSLIAVTVHRGGALARLGHDHVVASRDIHGEAMQQVGEPGRADLQFRLDQMSVDEPELRRQAGFDTQPGLDAISGTRNNMLTRVLQAERFPLVTIHATWPARPADPRLVDLKLAITLHGVTRTLDTQAAIATNGDALAIEGTLRIKQSDFGIVPFSVMKGALAVKDGLDLRFRIVADPR
jgi:polyisoprenoid-binding protein YceI